MNETQTTPTAAATGPYKGLCPECRLEITGPSIGQVNRNIGLHRRSKHGYQSPEYLEAKAYRENAKRKYTTPATPSAATLASLKKARLARWGKPAVKSKYSPAVVERRREYQQRYREAKRQERNEYKRQWAANKKSQLNHSAAAVADEAVPCKLSECPQCGTRFYMLKGKS